MWWKWISTASARGWPQFRGCCHTHSILICCKNLTSPKTLRKSLLIALHPLSFISQQGLGILTELQWFHSHPLVATDKPAHGTCWEAHVCLNGNNGSFQKPLWNLTGRILPMSLSSYCIPQRQVSAHLTIADMFFTMRPPGSTFSVPLEL